ncbi:MAG: tetratricopeptide repeat protein [Ignavibacteria bacterium]|nr:tetratricopeptide repeat protein [Ignavibacteria bacterium]
MAKAIKRSDEKVLQMYYNAIDYYEKNKKIVWSIITGIIVVVVVIFIYLRNQAAKSETAALELDKAKTAFMNNEYQKAIYGDSLGISKGLLYVVENYGSTESGETAKIMLAQSFYALRDFNSALIYFKDYGGKDYILKSTSIAGIGMVYDANGDYKNAAEYFEKASKVAKDNFKNEEYIYNSIRCYFYAKDTDNLKRIIKEFKTEYPKSKYLAEINRYDPPN